MPVFIIGLVVVVGVLAVSTWLLHLRQEEGQGQNSLLAQVRLAYEETGPVFLLYVSVK